MKKSYAEEWSGSTRVRTLDLRDPRGGSVCHVPSERISIFSPQFAQLSFAGLIVAFEVNEHSIKS